MRLLMISINDDFSAKSLGVTKKLQGQYNAFQKLGHETYRLCLQNGEVVLLSKGNKQIIARKKTKAYFSVCNLFLKAPKICREKQIDICYIRFPLADWAFMYMLKGVHKVCQKVVLEIPTFPYDNEAKLNKNTVARLNYKQDKINRKLLHKYVNLIVTISEDSFIYGVQCCNIVNGINIQDYTYIGDRLQYLDNINMIAVAQLANWHGYDRVIEGMNKYYSMSGNKERKRILFHIVGRGDAEDHLKSLVKKYGLQNEVRFYGTQSGKELESIYLKCQIAISSLGLHRLGLQSGSTLKNREYCAMGIPIIGEKDSGIPESSPFYRLCESNDQALKIEEVIDFFEYIKHHEEVHKKMRLYAEEHFTWENQLRKIFEAL